MPTIPTNAMERALRKEYLQWLAALPAQQDVTAALASFEARSREIIEVMGGQAASLGALADFPVPQTLDLSPTANVIYNDMRQAAISASITAGLNSVDAARQMFNAGLDKSYNKLERLARTETTNAYWKNAFDSVADLPALVMVWGSEESNKTCNYCLARDGLVIANGSMRDHPNGRCTPIPTLRSRLKYKGTLQPDGSVVMDPRFGKPAAQAPAQPAKGRSAQQGVAPAAKDQEPQTVRKGESMPGQKIPPKTSGLEGKDPRNMTAAERIKATEIMYGTGSKQHLQAMKTFKDKPKATPKPTPLPKQAPVNPRIIKSVKDMEDFGKGMPVPSSLSKGAAKAMDDYAKGTAYTANATLRGQKSFLGRTIDDRTKKYTKGFVKEMDSMMDASIIHQDVRVVRSVGADAFGGIDKIKDLRGGIYQDKGYMSTSLAEKTSSKIYDVKDAVDMEIEVPKGTRALYMAGESYLKSERELLLDRGTNLAIKSVTQDERTGRWKIVATVLPGPR